MASSSSSSSSSCKRVLESDSQTNECEGLQCKKKLKSDSPNTSSDIVESSCYHLNKVVIDLTVSDGDDDEQDETLKSEPAKPLTLIDDHYQCSSINAYSFIQGFGVKRFLVHHDYILFPYCFVSYEGKREKPTENRVSSIIHGFRDDCSYQTVLKNLKVFDSFLDQNTSTTKDMKVFAGHVLNGFNRFTKQMEANISKQSYTFLIDVYRTMKNFREGTDGENLYRNVFTSFLQILASEIKICHIKDEQNSNKGKVVFPLLGTKTEISGKPNIIILNADGTTDSTVAVIECKRFREVVVMSGDTQIGDDEDIEKTMSTIRFCTVNTSGKSDDNYDIATKERILERMYNDLDASICRPLRQQENNYFGLVFSQLVGEVLAWYQTYHLTTALVPKEIALKKSVRYGIGQLGFKIFFLTVGMNTSYMASVPHIRIGQNEGMGLDVFMTRPFDLMKADDRGKIRDIILAMMVMQTCFGN